MDSTGSTMVRRSSEAKVFRVQQAGLGWVIYLVGDPKAYGVSSRQLATTHARKLALKNRPSVVVVIDADGTVAEGWEFPVADPTVA